MLEFVVLYVKLVPHCAFTAWFNPKQSKASTVTFLIMFVFFIFLKFVFLGSI